MRTDPRAIARLAQMHQQPVSTRQGMQVAQTIGADAFLECSTDNGPSICEVIHRAALLACGQRAGRQSNSLVKRLNRLFRRRSKDESQVEV